MSALAHAAVVDPADIGEARLVHAGEKDALKFCVALGSKDALANRIGADDAHNLSAIDAAKLIPGALKGFFVDAVGVEAGDHHAAPRIMWL